MPTELPFRQLGQYEVLEHIAEGGMATVYLGRPKGKPDARVALKVIRGEHTRNGEFVAMFLDEARIASRLSHPNIVRVLELGHDGARHFLAMEHLRGHTLSRIADACHAKKIRMPYAMIAWIGARIADALHHAHELVGEDGKRHDIVHRDVNPSNVLVTYDGIPKVIDFGLARAADRLTSTAKGIVKGKLAYLSPEQIEGKPADARSDVFALGVTLWELTLSRRLFKTEQDVDTIRRVLSSEIPDPVKVDEKYPPELARIVMKALARDPKARWQNALELSKALDTCAKGMDAKRVSVFLASLFTQTEKILAWDDDAKKMTWLQLEGGAPRTAVDTDVAALVTLLEARTKHEDTIVKHRAFLELAIVTELLGDVEGAKKHARAALEVDPKSHAAATTLRRLADDPKMLDIEIAAATRDDVRADLLAERARRDGKKNDYESALAIVATHPASLAGLELLLDASPDHLAKVADAWAKEAPLAAWLRVERALLLEDPRAATDELKAALALDPGIGPVRDACIMHASTHRDFPWLVDLLDVQATLETDGTRAAMLELEAASIADDARAAKLLTRAAQRAPTPIDRLVLDELVYLHERAQRFDIARAARKARLPFLQPAARARELARMALLAERAGNVDAAIADIEQARAIEPDDRALLLHLERLVKPEAREALWAAEAARTSNASAWMRAIDLAPADRALAHARAAATACPDDAAIVDRLASLLSGAVRAPDERVAIYERAADLAVDAPRRIAWLERIALLWEDVFADRKMAALSWERVLAIDPERRSALRGLARTADDPSRALLLEAKLTTPEEGDRLRLRAARFLDPERALAIAREMLERRPDHEEARALALGIHEQQGRFAEVDRELDACIQHEKDPRAKVRWLVRQAEIRRTRLGSLAGAIASLEKARAIDPSIADDLVDLLRHEEPRALRDHLKALAGTSFLALAARIEEIDLGDDRAALATYEKAPDDPWVLARRERLRARIGKKQVTPAEGTIAGMHRAMHAAREKPPALANAIEMFLAALKTPGPKIGALWIEAAAIAKLPPSGTFDVYERILALSPKDRAALDALHRHAMRAGNRDVVTRALKGLIELAPDDTTRLVHSLELALLHEPGESALGHHRRALEIDPKSPTAALGLMRLAEVHGDNDGIVRAACARADLESGPTRATLLVRAAGLLLQSNGHARAIELLERALDADPCSTPAAGTLLSLVEDKQRLTAILKHALDRADRPDAIAMLGTEIARIAPAPIAISALERVRTATPNHAPTLLALAELYIADKAYPAAAKALEEAVEHASDPTKPLMALADLQANVFKTSPEATLRRVPGNDVRALRWLYEIAHEPEILARLAEHETTSEARAKAWLALADIKQDADALARAAAEDPSESVLAKIDAFCKTPNDHARVLGLAHARAEKIGRPSSAILIALANREIDLGRYGEGVMHARAALGLDPASHDARATQARGLAHAGSHAEAIAMALPLLDDGALLSLVKPDATLELLETSLHAARRDQESLVVRELRAIGGAHNDAIVIGLRARRLPDLGESGPAVLSSLDDRVTPSNGRHVLLEVARAIAGVKSFPGELEDLGTRVPVHAGHPLAVQFRRVARELAIEDAALFVSDAVVYPRAVHQGDPWVIVPPGLAHQPEPVQLASVARALARIALGMPWIDRMSVEDIRAYLTAAARIVSPTYGDEDGALVDLANDYAKPLQKGISRKHKKALSIHEDALNDSRAPSQKDVEMLLQCVRRAEMRVAFLLTGDLLSTLDDLRAADVEYARAAQTRGSAALVATLRHPIAKDVVRFALTDEATALRRELGSIWPT